MGGAVRILTAQPDPRAVAVNAEVGRFEYRRRWTWIISRSPAGESAIVSRCRRSASSAPLSTSLVISIERPPATSASPKPEPPGDREANQRCRPQERSNQSACGSRPECVNHKADLDDLGVDASNNSNYFSNLPAFTIAADYPSQQQVGLNSATWKWTTTSTMRP